MTEEKGGYLIPQVIDKYDPKGGAWVVVRKLSDFMSALSGGSSSLSNKLFVLSHVKTEWRVIDEIRTIT